jgi:Arc/MetJ family transcription regulator
MVKTLLDLDPELLEAAAQVLATTTKKDTVTAALKAAVAAAAQRQELQMLTSKVWVDPEVLSEVRGAGWRR